MTETREFPIGVVLSITHDVLMCDFGDVHEALEYMAGEPVWTHQLPRVAEEAKPIIFRDYPVLKDINTPDWNFEGWDQKRIMAAITDWLGEQEPVLGKTMTLHPMGTEHQSKGPITEMTEMMEKHHGPQ